MIRDNCELLVSFCCLFLLASVGSIDLIFYTTFETNITEKFAKFCTASSPNCIILIETESQQMHCFKEFMNAKNS